LKNFIKEKVKEFAAKEKLKLSKNAASPRSGEPQITGAPFAACGGEKCSS